jgi:hypothetical protein
MADKGEGTARQIQRRSVQPLPKSAPLLLALTAGLSLSISTAAQDIELDRGNVFHFRSVQGPNNTGFDHIDGIQLGIWITPADGSLVEAFQESSNGSIYPQSGTTTWGPFVLPRSPSPALPTEFSSLHEYGPAADAGLLGNWSLRVTNPGSPNSPAFFTTPSIVGASRLEFVTNTRLSVDPGEITLHWTNPDNSASVIDIEIQDLSSPREYFGIPPSQYIGFAPIVHQASNVTPGQYTPLPGDATSYTIPSTLSSGALLDPSRQYAASIMRYQFVDQEIDGQTYTVAYSRSRSFVNFVPGIDGGFTTPPQEVYIPTVTSNPDGTGTEFSFFIRELEPGMYFLDPQVAIGYEFRTGEGDPNFQSVLLPVVGDNQYQIFVFDPETGDFVTTGQAAQGDTEFFFSPDGVSAFKVLGIEENAGLDPNDPTAFVTGVSFVGGGDFTGKMIPIAVPEPGTYAVLAAGLFVLFAAVRRRRDRG